MKILSACHFLVCLAFLTEFVGGIAAFLFENRQNNKKIKTFPLLNDLSSCK